MGGSIVAFSMEWLTQYFTTIYDQNSYVNLLGMRIVKLEEGQALLSMLITTEKHTNLYHVAHGGALASLADTAMGIACATTGKQVVTLEMNMNFIKSGKPESTLRALGKVIHNGKSTLVAECDIMDQHNVVIAKGRGTFFVTGQFEGFPV
jgi:1,4-dihydroxy-2-naphthoyl-CoA hydrolase